MALAIDAATQVCCFREDLISLPQSWNELSNLAHQNKALALKPVHAISSFYSIYNNINMSLILKTKFINKEFGIKTLEMMKHITVHLTVIVS